MKESPFLSRKFILAVSFTIFGTALAFMGKLQADYVGLAALVIGAYAAGNVAAKRIDPSD